MVSFPILYVVEEEDSIFGLFSKLNFLRKRLGAGVSNAKSTALKEACALV